MTKNIVQYIRNGLGHSAIGSSIQELKAGYYDIALASGSTIVYIKKELKTDDLMCLSDTKSNDVIKEIKHFWTLKDRFKKLGMTHKRGFLLYGNQGSGKTSTTLIVVKQMIDDNGIVINGSSIHPVYLKQALHDFREIEPNRPLVVTLEDIDSLFQVEGETIYLSLLDGEASIDNVVYIATTNFPEKLKARVINRPSRFDIVVKIDMPTPDARRQYILHCDPKTSNKELESWIELTDGFSIAQMKEMIIGAKCFEHSAEDVAKRLRSSAIEITPDKRKIVKVGRDKTFFEAFYSQAESNLAPAELKKLRDAAVEASKPKIATTVTTK